MVLKGVRVMCVGFDQWKSGRQVVKVSDGKDVFVAGLADGGTIDKVKIGEWMAADLELTTYKEDPQLRFVRRVGNDPAPETV